MTIHLPNEVETGILAAVQSGRFASVEDAIAKAWLSYQQNDRPPAPAAGLGLIGALRDDAELLDQAVEHAMKVHYGRAIPSIPTARRRSGIATCLSINYSATAESASRTLRSRRPVRSERRPAARCEHCRHD